MTIDQPSPADLRKITVFWLHLDPTFGEDFSMFSGWTIPPLSIIKIIQEINYDSDYEWSDDLFRQNCSIILIKMTGFEMNSRSILNPYMYQKSSFDSILIDQSPHLRHWVISFINRSNVYLYF